MKDKRELKEKRKRIQEENVKRKKAERGELTDSDQENSNAEADADDNKDIRAQAKIQGKGQAAGKTSSKKPVKNQS